jgi:uncharacterized membrane protein
MILFKRNRKILLRVAFSGLSFAYPFLMYTYFQDLPSISALPLLYPVIVNMGMACVFGLSLVFPPTIIERIARTSTPDLDEDGMAYTRKVTQVWLAFFLSNAAASLGLTLYGDIALWTLYNGCISYILMGILFAGEYIVRRRHLATK